MAIDQFAVRSHGFAGCFNLDTGQLRATVPAPNQVYFAGYISNRQALLGALALPLAAADTELIQAAWKRWGKASVLHIHGAYCCVVLDRSTGEVLLAQDPLGMKTVFYCQVQGLLYFSDALEPLMGMLGELPLELDYWAAWLRYGYGRSRLTPYRDVYRLLNGEVRRIARSRTDSALPWRPRPQVWRAAQMQDACRALSDGVATAVRRTLADLQRPLFELSGGLDSSTVTCVAATQSAQTMRVLTWVGAGSADDEAYAVRLAADKGFIQQRVAMEDFQRVTSDFNAEPANELSGGLRLALASLTAGSDAVVTGVGGDNIFHSRGLPPLWLADDIRTGHWRRAMQRAQTQAHSGRAALRSPWSYLWLYGVRPLLHAQRSAFEPVYRYTDSFLARARDVPDVRHREGNNRVQEIFWEQIRGLIAGRVGVEHLEPQTCFRHPLLDRALVELCAGLAGVFEPALQADRQLQRVAFQHRVPDYILARQSKGGSVSADVARARDPVFRARVDGPATRIVALGLIAADEWTAILERAAYGRFASLREYDLLLKTELWLHNRAAWIAADSSRLQSQVGHLPIRC